MKAFVALVCLVGVVVSQEWSTPQPTSNATTDGLSTASAALTTATEAPTTAAEDPTTATETSTTTTGAPVTSTKKPTTQPPPTEPPVDCDISVGEDDLAVLLPNPESCESYYVCDAGQAILMPCPDGLHFNPELCVCDWPLDANCTAV